MEELTRKEEQILLAIHFLGEQAFLNSIQKRIREYTGKTYSLGTVYVPLNRLHMNGLLESRMKKISGSNKPVRFYQITNQGYEALSALKEKTDEMWAGFVKPVLK